MTTTDDISNELLSEAIVAYIGREDHRRYADDEDAVRALDPERGDQLIAAVKKVVAASDTIHIPPDAHGGNNASVLFDPAMEALWPGLSPEAMKSLVWRWAYIEYYMHG